MDGAVVKNLVIEDARVYGYNHVGILAGQIKGESVITDVTVEGTAAANTSSGGYASDAAVGGLAGKNFRKQFWLQGYDRKCNSNREYSEPRCYQ